MDLREAKQILESHNYILTEAKFSSFKDQIKKLVEHYKSRGFDVDVRNCTTKYTSYWFRRGYKELDFDKYDPAEPVDLIFILTKYHINVSNLEKVRRNVDYFNKKFGTKDKYEWDLKCAFTVRFNPDDNDTVKWSAAKTRFIEPGSAGYKTWDLSIDIEDAVKESSVEDFAAELENTANKSIKDAFKKLYDKTYDVKGKDIEEVDKKKRKYNNAQRATARIEQLLGSIQVKDIDTFVKNFNLAREINEDLLDKFILKTAADEVDTYVYEHYSDEDGRAGDWKYNDSYDYITSFISALDDEFDGDIRKYLDNLDIEENYKPDELILDIIQDDVKENYIEKMPSEDDVLPDNNPY